jgi:hypothetical protein
VEHDGHDRVDTIKVGRSVEAAVGLGKPAALEQEVVIDIA